jgi:hypothetical protein
MGKNPMEQISGIWREIKEMKRLQSLPYELAYDSEQRLNELQNRYEEVEVEFGKESTLDKAIIYYLNQQK